MQKPKVKNMFSPRTRIKSPPGKQAAQQQFKDDADINSIMRKFQKTGTIDHVSKYQSEYGFATPQSLHEAANVVARAQTMFEELPSLVRNKFSNRPEDFLAFVQDPKNADECIELGLALAPEAAAQAAATEPGTANPGEVDPPAGGNGGQEPAEPPAGGGA